MHRPARDASLLMRAIAVLRNEGAGEVVRRSFEALHDILRPPSYARWIARYDTINDEQRAQMEAEVARWPAPPTISVVLMAGQADASRVVAAARSVEQQIYPHWELLVAATPLPREAWTALHALAAQDGRARLALGIDINAVASVLASTRGEFVALLYGDDLLPAHALYWMANEILRFPRADLLFSDEDRIGDDGKRHEPWFKSDWNPALMLSCNAFGRLGLYRRRLLEAVAPVRLDREHDLVLRCSERVAVDCIRHVPRVLYHRRWPSGVTGPDADIEAVRGHLRRIASDASIVAGEAGHFRVEPPISRPLPRVSVLVPTTVTPRLLGQCLETLLGISTYDDFEVLLLVAERHRADPEKAAMLSRWSSDSRIRVVACPDGPFNYSAANNLGIAQASGSLICFLNDDTTVITPSWLERLVARVMRPGVAAAGPLLLYPDDRIQHAGVVLGLNGVAGHAGHMLPRGSPGYHGRCRLEQDVSCLTAACLVVRADVLRKIGGLDEALPIAFNDVDLCLRLRAAGWRLIFTPTAELLHHESASVGRPNSRPRREEFARAVALMRRRWAAELDADPCYNANLSLRRAFHLAFPPRV